VISWIQEPEERYSRGVNSDRRFQGRVEGEVDFDGGSVDGLSSRTIREGRMIAVTTETHLYVHQRLHGHTARAGCGDVGHCMVVG
jgi:hypothetical protein